MPTDKSFVLLQKYLVYVCFYIIVLVNQYFVV